MGYRFSPRNPARCSITGLAFNQHFVSGIPRESDVTTIVPTSGLDGFLSVWCVALPGGSDFYVQKYTKAEENSAVRFSNSISETILLPSAIAQIPHVRQLCRLRGEVLHQNQGNISL